MADTRALDPAYFELNDAYVSNYKSQIRALKSLHSGKATEAEQLMALDYILTVLCNRAGNQYFQNDRDTCFALGRKFVGDHIVSAIKVPITSQEK